MVELLLTTRLTLKIGLYSTRLDRSIKLERYIYIVLQGGRLSIRGQQRILPIFIGV